MKYKIPKKAVYLEIEPPQFYDCEIIPPEPIFYDKNMKEVK